MCVYGWFHLRTRMTRKIVGWFQQKGKRASWAEGGSVCLACSNSRVPFSETWKENQEGGPRRSVARRRLQHRPHHSCPAEQLDEGLASSITSILLKWLCERGITEKLWLSNLWPGDRMRGGRREEWACSKAWLRDWLGERADSEQNLALLTSTSYKNLKKEHL